MRNLGTEEHQQKAHFYDKVMTSGVVISLGGLMILAVNAFTSGSPEHERDLNTVIELGIGATAVGAVVAGAGAYMHSRHETTPHN